MRRAALRARPQDIYGPDFAGETFRVLEASELKRFGDTVPPGRAEWGTLAADAGRWAWRVGVAPWMNISTLSSNSATGS